MSHILIINGYQTYGDPKGKLNETLADEMEHILKEKHEIKRTNIDKGYSISEEQEKFVWADTIIFQTPVYWFNVPGLLKTYIDEVYKHGIFFSGPSEYGRGGLFKDKYYMLSTTWNAPVEAFQKETAFLGGNTVDDIFLGFHKTQEFVGLKKLETFTVHDVVHRPQIEIYLKQLRNHLEATIK
ncbi:NAD(P)H-dependent oxidoreductase [Terrilactibacillus laevilacticus]|uniref:NAD(P)H-dependent oxidoreductase n=1 Tax=Terrilactibacillus laevilacticus TaxID=1380157 RepID=A0ABW5PQP6_9BACI|nr:NAD(P)H-dependent oxidoreductase [Terrilactibacillus laevilacticus]